MTAPYEVVAWGFGWPEDAAPDSWSSGGIKCHFIVEALDPKSTMIAFFRLANGQVIRMRLKPAPLSATARCE